MAWVPPGALKAAAAPSPSHPAVARLYRHALVAARTRLPADSRQYYAEYARQNFVAFADEEDAERVASLVSRGYESIEWVVRKYVEQPSRSPADR